MKLDVLILYEDHSADVTDTFNTKGIRLLNKGDILYLWHTPEVGMEVIRKEYNQKTDTMTVVVKPMK